MYVGPLWFLVNFFENMILLLDESPFELTPTEREYGTPQ